MKHLDKETQARIINALRGLEEVPQIGDIKKLRGKDDELRLRIGKYLVIFANLLEFVYGYL